MDEERQRELEYNQNKEYSRRIRNARKQKEEENRRKEADKKEVIISKTMKVWGWIKKYCYWIIPTFIPFILLILIVSFVGFMVVYCVANPEKCFIETVKEAAKAVVE